MCEGIASMGLASVVVDCSPGCDELWAAYSARVAEKTIFERLFWRLTGLELKLQQYVVGERFCKAVHGAHGMELLNRAWEGPETLPTAEELRSPELWVARMNA